MGTPLRRFDEMMLKDKKARDGTRVQESVFLRLPG